MPTTTVNKPSKSDKHAEQMAILQTLIDMKQKNVSPYSKGVEKALKQAGEQHAMEAIQQGVPGDHIASQSGLNPQDILKGLTSWPPKTPGGDIRPLVITGKEEQQQPQVQPQEQTVMQPQQQFQQQPQVNIPKQRMFEAADVYGQRLENLGKIQALQGRTPLQQGEREKIGLEGIKELIKIELQATKELAKQKVLTPNELMTKFENASQPFIVQRDSYARIKSLGSNPSPAGDLGLIFSYMKLLDPPSVVREGEQATAENARGVPDGIRNLYNKLITGQKLTIQQRTDFFNKSESIFKSIKAQQKKTTEEFSRLGRMNGIDSKTFIRDTGLSESENVSSVWDENKESRLNELRKKLGK